MIALIELLPYLELCGRHHPPSLGSSSGDTSWAFADNGLRGDQQSAGHSIALDIYTVHSRLGFGLGCLRCRRLTLYRDLSWLLVHLLIAEGERVKKCRRCQP